MTILKPIALFILIISTSLVVTQSNKIQPNNSSNGIIEQTCIKTPNYALCVEYLKSYPGSSEETVNGLAMIMFRIMKDKALQTQVNIRALLPKAVRPQKGALIECLDLYQSIYADGSNGVGALQRAPINIKVAEFCANDAQNKANICEHKFFLGGPLTDSNNIMKDLAKITAAIVSLI